MKVTKRTIWVLVAVLAAVILAGVIMAACQGGDTTPSTVPAPSTTVGTTVPETSTAETTVPETTVPETTVPETSVPETEPPETEPPFVCYNPMTGEGLYETSENRPYAVVFNNIKAAQPQYGTSQADVFCEILVEGTTRCLGIYYDFEGVETFGSIRSARPYLVHLAQSFNAVLVHAGGSTEAYDYMSSAKWSHIDGVNGYNAAKYYYRDQGRLNAGYAREHTMFIKPEDVIAYATERGCTLTTSGGVDYGWAFTDTPVTGEGEAASTITAYFGLSTNINACKSTSLRYNEQDGLYYAYQYNTEWTDAGAEKQLAFRNVLILRCSTVSQGDSAGHLTITTTGTGSGYYACDGKLIPISWSRSSNTAPFVFTTESGEVLELAEGQSYIGVVTKSGIVNYE